ncbi:hypothetical protein QJS10_CPA03g01647 [Acorus calamus]|uniref:Uncharacterized protein n=1 Tax=Acorus calamus TaxID=4465 RepID=A0AAV9F5S5_ACOCL|nr:hypothetical protein QJS10_CPA03g01647 [Acorus calamus]
MIWGLSPSLSQGGSAPANLPRLYPYGLLSKHEGVAWAEEGEEEDEIKKLFNSGKKKKKPEKTPAEIALLVESLMAELEVTTEEDA